MHSLSDLLNGNNLPHKWALRVSPANALHVITVWNLSLNGSFVFELCSKHWRSLHDKCEQRVPVCLHVFLGVFFWLSVFLNGDFSFCVVAFFISLSIFKYKLFSVVHNNVLRLKREIRVEAVAGKLHPSTASVVLLSQRDGANCMPVRDCGRFASWC